MTGRTRPGRVVIGTLGLDQHSIQVFVQAVPGYVSGFVLSAAVGAGYQYL